MEPNKPTQSTPMKPSSSSFSTFKSKKILGSSPKPAPSSDPNTPLKATPTSQFRQRTRSKVPWVSQIRKIAQELNRPSKKIPSNSSSDPVPSTPLKKKKKSLNAIQLPERLETLAKLFDNMVCSIRLLRLKGTMCTFPNICKTMESLTDRDSLLHVSHIKFEAYESSSTVVPMVVPMEEIASIEPGQTTKRTIQVHFPHHLLPLKLVICCNGRKLPVKLRPDIGYFVKPLPMDIKTFTNEESQLPGMFEYTRRFQQNMDTYKNLIMQSMYDKQLDSGRGTLLHLCDDVVQQEVKEVIIAYYILMEQGKATREQTVAHT